MLTLWDHRFAQRTQRMESSAIRELLKFTENPDVISFAGGMPAPEVFPIEKFKEACLTVLDQNGPASLQYGSTDGYAPLREMIARYSARYGINVTIDNILITSGSQQALDLLGKILINPGDGVLVESPTYVGALQAWRAYGAEFVPVPTDEDGMMTSKLESCLRAGPKFIYALPNFQNPTGSTLAYDRRLKLIELAENYGVPIVEDDPYGQLRFEGENLPAIEVLDSQTRAQEECYSGNVIYLSTFSKTLAPGIRLAWVIAPPPVITKLIQAKQGTDLHTSTFNQMVAYEVAKDGFLYEHAKLIRKVYKERRDVMLDTLSEYMPEGVSWTHPKGGLFLWVTLPECLNSQDLFKDAVAEKVAFVPGDSFYAEGGGFNTMRLNFSNACPERINEGIFRLANVLKKHLVANS
ncbi:aminotransferase-like domain-containing protein [Pelolinea submarina]|uniref:2-aminoadipate transaminase n=1 Tax=Pelolinea submarina TaxID=913107 RepID=A0A347ZSW4_9CHLR|nr:PLP-dependent aminotransferase family protein [Pelolinea submarina]REG11030.1 2-aminoadipate transaminase [Pelolinea submarina]BBB48395.1 2-aminoadipate transaminase [Pelolinea submarina]